MLCGGNHMTNHTHMSDLLNNGALRRSPAVLVAGGGPAGLSTATELAYHGIPCIVVEPRSQVSHMRPRAKTISPRTMEILRRWGLADRVRQAAPLKPEWSRRIIFCTTLDGDLITHFDDAFGLRSGPDELFAEGGQQVPQPTVEDVLRTHLSQTGLVDLRCGERLTAVVEREEDVACEITRDDGSSYELIVSYVVGADGARSTCGATIGSNLHGVSAPRSNMNLVFRAPELRPTLGDAVQYWVLGPAVKGTIGPLDLDGLWWAALGGVESDCSPQIVTGHLRRLLGESNENLELEVFTTDPWVPRMLLADRWCTDRIFLVGESAHVNPPFGGHGFNTCVGDAVNLGWKLAAVLEGWATPDLLRTYATERREIARLTIDAARRNLEASGPDIAMTHDRLQATKREEFHSLGLVLGYSYAGSPCVAATETPRFDPVDFSPSFVPGARLPHSWTGTGRALYDDLGRGFTLLSNDRGPDAAITRYVAAATDQGIPLKALRFTPDENAPEHILVRPDQHIAWTGSELDMDALCRAVGHGVATG